MGPDEKILLVGGGGFVGVNLYQKLKSMGVSVLIYDITKPSDIDPHDYIGGK